MKKILFLLMIVISLTTTLAENPLNIKINEGRNNFTIEEYFPPVYASQLIADYPGIQSVSVKEYGQSLGYINLFGGIGTNFLIESGKNYEIYTSKNITLSLKN